MADVWQFSESSQKLLESCLNAAKIAPKNLEFSKLFALKETPEKHLKQECNDVLNDAPADSTVLHEPDLDRPSTQENVSQIFENEDEAVRISSVLEVSSDKLEYLLSHCDNEELIPIIAEKLSTANLEAICVDFFNRQNIDVTFAHNFVTQFFAALIKRKSAIVLDLLCKAHASYPEPFKILITNLLKDIESPNKILEQFILSFKNTNFSDVLNQISNQNVTKDAFIHHLNTFCCLYKNSQKNFEIQEFILQQLLDSAKQCSDDKVYGKFLLTFFQGLKASDYPINKPLLEKLTSLTNDHRTMFKRLCLNIFYTL